MVSMMMTKSNECKKKPKRTPTKKKIEELKNVSKFDPEMKKKWRIKEREKKKHLIIIYTHTHAYMHINVKH